MGRRQNEGGTNHHLQVALRLVAHYGPQSCPARDLPQDLLLNLVDTQLVGRHAGAAAATAVA